MDLASNFVLVALHCREHCCGMGIVFQRVVLWPIEVMLLTYVCVWIVGVEWNRFVQVCVCVAMYRCAGGWSSLYNRFWERTIVKHVPDIRLMLILCAYRDNNSILKVTFPLCCFTLLSLSLYFSFYISLWISVSLSLSMNGLSVADFSKAFLSTHPPVTLIGSITYNRQCTLLSSSIPYAM